MSKVPVLFDVNGSFGKKSTGQTDFPAIRDRLEHMNRLGINRSLVWNVESFQGHALSCNSRLIEEIQKTPGAEGRVIPALAVSALMCYEQDGVETLIRQMKSMGTRALRFTNVFSRLTLCQLEPVMRKIQRLKPFIVMRHDQASVPDILEFTAMFPEIPLVLTEVMWGPCVVVFDLMRRRKNIMVDNSWLHSGGAIEIVVKHFGADRLLFGTGHKSHNGAAIAALARADITDAQRQLIAYGNLNRLAGVKGTTKGNISQSTGNTLWTRFLEGKPLGVDVVDAHVHIGPSGGYVLEAQEEGAQIAAALKAMKSIGIKTMIVSGLQALMGGPVEGNDLLESALRPHAKQFAGYVAFNPFYADELLAQLDRYFSGQVFLGFKTLCGYWGVTIDDKRFNPMWAYANRHHLPVLNHTWEGQHNSPAMLKDVVKRYPHVQFLLGHSGGGDAGRREAEELACKNRNVYLEWCGSFCSSMTWEETLRKVDYRQIVFGTDAMAHEINWELGRLLSLDVPEKTLAAILGGNMRRVLAMRK